MLHQWPPFILVLHMGGYPQQLASNHTMCCLSNDHNDNTPVPVVEQTKGSYMHLSHKQKKKLPWKQEFLYYIKKEYYYIKTEYVQLYI